jgi:hypothetical protein
MVPHLIPHSACPGLPLRKLVVLVCGRTSEVAKQMWTSEIRQGQRFSLLAVASDVYGARVWAEMECDWWRPAQAGPDWSPQRQPGRAGLSRRN